MPLEPEYHSSADALSFFLPHLLSTAHLNDPLLHPVLSDNPLRNSYCMCKHTSTWIAPYHGFVLPPYIHYKFLQNKDQVSPLACFSHKISHSSRHLRDLLSEDNSVGMRRTSVLHSLLHILLNASTPEITMCLIAENQNRWNKRVQQTHPHSEKPLMASLQFCFKFYNFMLLIFPPFLVWERKKNVVVHYVSSRMLTCMGLISWLPLPLASRKFQWGVPAD